jgi:hypothetical protein
MKTLTNSSGHSGHANLTRFARTTLVLALGVLGLLPLGARAQTNCAPVPSGLVCWWRGEGDASDALGEANGSFYGGVAFAPGKVGQCFAFDGVNGAINVPDAPALALTNSLTIEGWLFVTNAPAALGEVLLRGDQRFGLDPYSLSVRSDDGVSAILGFGLTDQSDHVAAINSLMPTGVWTHVAATLEGATGLMRLYTNGVAAAETSTAIRPLGPLDPLYSPGVGIGNHSSQPGPFLMPFRGRIDELSVYNRALLTSEVQAIYNAGSAGKCGLSPALVTQPTNLTVVVGATAQFTVTATGTPPLSYQWRWNGTNLAGATSTALILSNVQLSQAGTYAVQVTNAAGSTNSSDAILTVTPPLCVPSPSGMTAWWAAETNANDSLGTANGSLYGGVTYAPGKVGQCFAFDGVNGAVNVPDVPALALSNSLSIEAWLFVTNTPSGVGMVIFRGDTRSGLDPYSLNLGPAGDGSAVLSFGITDPSNTGVGLSSVMPTGTWTHVAATLDDATGLMCLYTNAVIAAQTTTTLRPLGPLAPGYSPGVGVGNHSSQPGSFNYPFRGRIDELSVYSKALSPTEVQAIYKGGTFGKCPVPPNILVQPTNRTVFVGDTALFSVIASGTVPLNYQWQWNGTNLAATANSSLTLTNVQFSQAGSYSVEVVNAGGSTNSSNAVLTVLPPPPCTPPPANLISWWRAETNMLDQIGTNNGTLVGNVTYGPGRVGQGFVFDGSGDAVRVGTPANLQLQTFTIEAWVRRSSASVVSYSAIGNGIIFGYGTGGYGFFLDSSGTLSLTKVGVDQIKSTVAITDTNFHHLAVTKSGTTVLFYVDGVPYSAAAYGSTFTFTTQAAIGARGDNADSGFLGTIDEVAVYSRVLSSAEVQAIYNAAISGKCLTPVPAFLIAQPTSQIVTAGVNVTLSAVAAGSVPISFQWQFNGAPLSGATVSALTLTNVQLSQAGSYSVLVTNSAGVVMSSNAVLTVNFPPAPLRVLSTNAPAGGNVAVPVVIVANGNEYALGFSLSFDTAKLTYAGATLGPGAPGADLLQNTSLINSGKLGLSIVMPTGTTLSPGTQQLARVNFVVAVLTNATTATNSFSDQPTPRQLWDAQLNPQPAIYSNGTVAITAATAFEGDVFPRPGGDKSATLSDWLQMARYVARLDYPTNAAELQRADCAPRSTLGDGAITVTDWVQAGRYAFGLDPLTAVGGPSSEAPYSGAGPSAGRVVTAGTVTLFQGRSGTVRITLASQGNENALGFSLSFDPSLVSFTGASLGADAGGATLYVNTAQASSGRVGFALARGVGNTFPAGTREILMLNFQASSSVAGSFAPAFGDLPVPRDVSDAMAVALPASYASSTIVVTPIPSLRIALEEQAVRLTWPLWATNFLLQQSDGATPVPWTWTNLPVSVATSNNECAVTLPLSSAREFYQLYLP